MLRQSAILEDIAEIVVVVRNARLNLQRPAKRLFRPGEIAQPEKCAAQAVKRRRKGRLAFEHFAENDGGLFAVAALMQGKGIVAAEIMALRRIPQRGEKVRFGFTETPFASQQNCQQMTHLGMVGCFGGDFFQKVARGGEITPPVSVLSLGKCVLRGYRMACCISLGNV